MAAALFLCAIPLLSSTEARADLKICNRMSYVVEAAIGIEDRTATATRGWFRIDPAACRVVASGNITADRILLHARSLPVYGASPAPQNGTDNLCVAQKDFVIAGRQCNSQTSVPFTEIKPSTSEDGHQVAYLAEGAEYDDEQADSPRSSAFWSSRAMMPRRSTASTDRRRRTHSPRSSKRAALPPMQRKRRAF
jgi:uncharacterized membrane protein